LEQVRNDAGPQTFLLVAKIERLHWLSKKNQTIIERGGHGFAISKRTFLTCFHVLVSNEYQQYLSINKSLKFITGKYKKTNKEYQCYKDYQIFVVENYDLALVTFEFDMFDDIVIKPPVGFTIDIGYTIYHYGHLFAADKLVDFKMIPTRGEVKTFSDDVDSGVMIASIEGGPGSSGSPILMIDAQSKQLVLLGIVIGSMGKNDTQDCLKVVLISNLTKKAKQLTNLATLSNMQSVSWKDFIGLLDY